MYVLTVNLWLYTISATNMLARLSKLYQLSDHDPTYPRLKNSVRAFKDHAKLVGTPPKH